jgi:hypothetical protein
MTGDPFSRLLYFLEFRAPLQNFDLPFGLRFERLFAIVGRSVPADDHEEGVCA